MPLRLDIKKSLLVNSDRVKAVDLHPTEPWLLAALYSGIVQLWNYNTKTLVKSFEVTELPVRAAKFIPRKQWIICGADDMFIRVYNYNTGEKVKAFEAHQDYIRSLSVSPTLPYVISCADDMTIKLWNWEQDWNCTRVYEGHTHYVMCVTFNPKDPNTFASASLDRTIKVWGVGSAMPYFTLEGHEKGVNYVDYFTGNDKPFLISGADDRTCKIWDYTTKACVQTLEGHSHNVSVCAFHPELPIIVTGSEDGSVRIWHSTTYRLENTLSYNMERVWAIGTVAGSNKVALGFDDGTVMIKIGREEPAVSMDDKGKIIVAKHSGIVSLNVKNMDVDNVEDGERTALPQKDLGSSEVYPQSLKHDRNGRFVALVGDGEYTIYTAIAWRNKSYGQASEFVWGNESGSYALRDGGFKIAVHKNFKEKQTLKPDSAADGIFGGHLLGIRFSDAISFYDWETMTLIRKIDIYPKNVFWSESGEFVVLACEDSFFMLRFDATATHNAEEYDEEEGFDNAFDVEHEFDEVIAGGQWTGDCFIYVNSQGRLNHIVGGYVSTIAHVDTSLYFLGYIPKENRVYMCDKDTYVVSYKLSVAVLQYEMAIMRDDVEEGEKLLKHVPKECMNQIAVFLDAQDRKDLALHVATDPDHKFELALQVKNLEVAYDIVKEYPSEFKWRQIADLALSRNDFKLAESSMISGDDFNGLLLLYSSTGNGDGMRRLAKLAKEQARYSVAFVCSFLVGNVDECIEILKLSKRVPEAAFMARTYKPSAVTDLVKSWREDLKKVNPKIAEALADPAGYPNLFPQYDVALKAEQFLKEKRQTTIPAERYPAFSEAHETCDIIQEMEDMAVGGGDDESESESVEEVVEEVVEVVEEGDIDEDDEDVEVVEVVEEVVEEVSDDEPEEEPAEDASMEESGDTEEAAAPAAEDAEESEESEESAKAD